MKSSIVPAQITTVEDKVAGNLSLSQLLLLAAPGFLGSAIYIVFPPSMGAAMYKLVMVMALAAGFSLLALRVRGRILLLWLITIARYNLRPQHYVFNKNDPYLRDIRVDDSPVEVAEPVVDDLEAQQSLIPLLSALETVRLEGIIADPKAKLQFVTDRKGALRVRITEIV